MKIWIATLAVLLLLAPLLLASCSRELTKPTEYLSTTGCTDSGDLYFTITNIGRTNLTLDTSHKGLTHFSLEVNNVELTNLPNYCGRSQLTPNEVVKCRRPTDSKTDAGILLQTKRSALLLKSQNTIRAIAADTTREIKVACD